MTEPNWKEQRYRRGRGRPKLDRRRPQPSLQENMVSITTFVHRDQRVYLDAKADALGSSLGEAVRTALDLAMEHDPNTEAYLLGKPVKEK